MRATTGQSVLLLLIVLAINISFTKETECRLDTSLIDSICMINKHGADKSPEESKSSRGDTNFKTPKEIEKGYHKIPKEPPVRLEIIDPAVAIFKGMAFAVNWDYDLVKENQ